MASGRGPCFFGNYGFKRPAIGSREGKGRAKRRKGAEITQNERKKPCIERDSVLYLKG